jgi:FkbM family methyltransferase
MIGHLRRLARSLLPARAVHAYRMFVHTRLFPFEQEIALLPRFLDAEKVAVDIGANVGVFTTLMTRHARKVLAFEPHPSCAAQLRSLRLRNCEVIEAALSDRDGTAVLRVPLAERLDLPALSTLAAGNDFQTQPEVGGVRELTVATTRLDAALASRLGPADEVGFIKIDVEGHELAVLRGAVETIARHRPVLIVETEARHGVDLDEVFRLLVGHGYAARALIDGDLAPIDPKTLRELQAPERLARKLSEPRYFGYVNNVFFLPQDNRAMQRDRREAAGITTRPSVNYFTYRSCCMS